MLIPVSNKKFEDVLPQQSLLRLWMVYFKLKANENQLINLELIKTYIGLEVFMLQRTPLSQLSAVVRATMTMLFLECNKFGVNIIPWNILSRGWL